MKSTNQVNWVKERADCYLPNVFEHLKERVQFDVEQARHCSPIIKREYQLMIEEESNSPIFVVKRMAPPPLHTVVAIQFELGQDSILVHCPSHPKYHERQYFRITSTWNDEQGRCQLTIDKHDQPYTLWQLSREALGHLVFPSQL